LIYLILCRMCPDIKASAYDAGGQATCHVPSNVLEVISDTGTRGWFVVQDEGWALRGWTDRMRVWRRACPGPGVSKRWGVGIMVTRRARMWTIDWTLWYI
jgi:hypothetical protein